MLTSHHIKYILSVKSFLFPIYKLSFTKFMFKSYKVHMGKK